MVIMTRDYQPEGVKYHFPDDDPYQESNEIYYNMVDFLDDAEVHQIWEIVGKALDRNNIVTKAIEFVFQKCNNRL